MRRSTGLILALASIPLGLTLIVYALKEGQGRQSSDSSQTMASEMNRNSVAPQGASADAAQSNVDPRGVSAKPPNAQDAVSGESNWSSQSPQPGRRSRPTQTDPEEVVTEREEKAAERAPDNSVVGRPFQPSESIVEACKPDRRGVFRSSFCHQVGELLTAMAREPRDEAWAAAAEQALRAYAEKEPGKFTIRALECRKSICFIETASIYGSLLDPDYEYDKYLSNLGLHMDYAVDAFETDATGARMTVTLFPFTRK
jgi:hypothetical protein